MDNLFYKIDRLLEFLRTPGSFKARINGCWLDFYKVAQTFKRMGITPQTVLDIGASCGMFSRCINYVFPEARIIAFEPLSDPYRELRQLEKKVANLRCFQIALGDQKTETVMYRHEYHYSSSILKMSSEHAEIFPYTREFYHERVKVERLDDFLIGETLQHPILAKIDVQGYEGIVLDGGQKTFGAVDYLICEVSLKRLYESQPLFDEMYKKITALGFRYAGQLGELRNPNTSETLQVDAFFSRVI